MYVDPPHAVCMLESVCALWYILETDFKVSLLLSQDTAFTMVGKDLWLPV